MTFEGIDVATMRMAIELYLQIAWGNRAAEKAPSIAWEECGTPEDVLKSFRKDPGTGNMRRFALRLGHPTYPFMKVLFQELLVRDRFFFCVDTHDDHLELDSSISDYDQFLELKRQNAEVKERVEEAWAKAGIPTFAEVVAQVERETPPGAAADSEGGPMVLIVDDDAEIARGVRAILGRRGCQTAVVHSAESALSYLEQNKPDLILSDLEMGGISGLELARKLVQDPELKDIPFILATAASISPSHFHSIDGYLVKPYDTAVLLAFVREHLAGTHPLADPAPAKESSS